ncbi:MAG: hypothetical protein DRJ18_01350 [Candidatus Methanomethylicota archaeon]|nr:MAG: hypothetical protein DRJ18_01350 [Candidatus Verstraetearchaeota archaeon]
MKKQKRTTVKKPQLPAGKLVRSNLSMSQEGLEALEKLEKRKACKTHAEAFHMIHSVASELGPQLKDLIKDTFPNKTTPVKIRKTFGVNEYTLSGFKRLAKKYDLAVESIIETTVRFIDALVSLSHIKPFKNRSEALKVIETLMEQANELRWRLEKTFPEQGDDTDDPENPAYHFVTIDAGLDGLYFLVKDKLFDGQT